MKPIVFAGPSLSGDPAFGSRDFAWRPPASEGDVYRAACLRPEAIALIDGRFEDGPSVWHKEILWALANGIAVFGAASMGALRAAELDRFGMIGIGPIYRAYRDGRYEDDDEVAVVHAPRELGYAPLTVAMVDIRATIREAQRAGIVQAKDARAVVNVAKQTFFKERSWETILHNATLSWPQRTRRRVRDWIAANQVSQKRLDALSLLETVRTFRGPAPAASFEFQSTTFWQALLQRQENPKRFRR